MSWLSRTIVPTPFKWGLSTSQADFNRKLKWMGLSTFNYVSHGAHATTHSFQDDSGAEVLIVSVGPSLDKTIEDVYGLLVHEAVHVWQAARESIGEKEPSGEFEAYAIQNIAQTLMEAWRKKMKNKHPGFKAVQDKIAKKEGISKDKAGAILAASSRKASPKAKAKNPRLRRVK